MGQPRRSCIRLVRRWQLFPAQRTVDERASYSPRQGRASRCRRRARRSRSSRSDRRSREFARRTTRRSAAPETRNGPGPASRSRVRAPWTVHARRVLRVPSTSPCSHASRSRHGAASGARATPRRMRMQIRPRRARTRCHRAARAAARNTRDRVATCPHDHARQLNVWKHATQ